MNFDGTWTHQTDDALMRMALHAAHDGAAAGEVPVGAVLLQRNPAGAVRVLGVGHNTCVAAHDPTAHAEVNALRQAALALGNYRMDDCELFVTLEPCAMCAGAALNARLRRVVFGAAEAKTGAAGSVTNLFALKAINPHNQTHTRVQGGVLADECAQPLQAFFKAKRMQHAQTAQPLREDALRTPDAAFNALPGYPWAPNHLSDTPALAGLRMHYLDVGAKNAERTFLCLHGNPGWSYLYRHMIDPFLASGARVVVPDLIGFGKSDKPKKASAHSFTWHRQTLLEFVQALDLRNVTLVVQDWGGLLGLTLPMAAPGRYERLLVMNTTLATGETPLSEGFLAWRAWCKANPNFDVAKLFARGNPHLSAAEAAAYNAPFPDAGHRAALRAFPPMVPEFPHSDGATTSAQAAHFLANADGLGWHGKSFMAIGARDPVLGPAVMQALASRIHGCPPPLVLPQAGQFVQEHGAQVAQAALAHWGDRPG